jgi:hypothetical protein
MAVSSTDDVFDAMIHRTYVWTISTADAQRLELPDQLLEPNETPPIKMHLGQAPKVNELCLYTSVGSSLSGGSHRKRGVVFGFVPSSDISICILLYVTRMIRC